MSQNKKPAEKLAFVLRHVLSQNINFATKHALNIYSVKKSKPIS
jgi:hypothetical protein